MTQVGQDTLGTRSTMTVGGKDYAYYSLNKAAAKIGDDALQKQSQGRVVPESFTHGTSAQRTRWFNIGLQTGAVKACDTFGTRSL